jgi:hypothetical protein
MCAVTRKCSTLLSIWSCTCLSTLVRAERCSRQNAKARAMSYMPVLCFHVHMAVLGLLATREYRAVQNQFIACLSISTSRRGLGHRDPINCAWRIFYVYSNILSSRREFKHTSNYLFFSRKTLPMKSNAAYVIVMSSITQYDSAT